MKYLKFFLMFGVIFVVLSSYSLRATELSEGIYPGELFPEIHELKNISGENVRLSDLRGEKVFVNFWAAYDADSHMGNVLFSRKIEKEAYPVKMISLSLDKSKSVFEKTVILDKIDVSLQLWVNGSMQEELANRHRLQKGFHNYLLDENGKIIAKNLTLEELGQLLEVN